MSEPKTAWELAIEIVDDTQDEPCGAVKRTTDRIDTYVAARIAEAAERLLTALGCLRPSERSSWIDIEATIKLAMGNYPGSPDSSPDRMSDDEEILDDEEARELLYAHGLSSVEISQIEYTLTRYPEPSQTAGEVEALREKAERNRLARNIVDTVLVGLKAYIDDDGEPWITYDRPALEERARTLLARKGE